MKTPPSRRILAIETSCDETAIAILEASEEKNGTHFNILADKVSSQIAVHAPFGGVVPNLAKREHQKNLSQILLLVLKEAGFSNFKMQIPRHKQIANSKIQAMEKILERETELLKEFKKQIIPLPSPPIDAIAVTYGPGLEPALWVGINFARALSKLWNLPLTPVNHLEGHIYSSMMRNFKFQIPRDKEIFPLLTLIVSGGHTELVLTKTHLSHKILGETHDDAAGEAFDKVAKMLGLSYPGGPEISKRAIYGSPTSIDFPRPMLHSKDLNFSFSGLKTSVLYYLRDAGKISDQTKNDIAASFQQAAIDVLVKKTLDAVKKYKPKAIGLGGGVAANNLLRAELKENIPKIMLPEKIFTGDNASMITTAAYFHLQKKIPRSGTRPGAALKANGALRLS